MNKDFFKRNLGSIIAVLIIVILVALYAWPKTRRNIGEQIANTPVQTDTKTAEPKANNTADTDENLSGTPGEIKYQGTLNKSDNLSKGTLMITTASHALYMRTSRDYSGLIGKTVVITGTGDLNKFTLKDIVEAHK